MTGSVMLGLLQVVATSAWLAWVAACMARDFGRALDRHMRWASAVFFELRPFMPAALIVGYLGSAERHGWRLNPWDVFGLLIGLLLCWFRRNDKDDDDRWKRRGRKLSERIAQVGGRLQVVPVGSRS